MPFSQVTPTMAKPIFARHSAHGTIATKAACHALTRMTAGNTCFEPDLTLLRASLLDLRCHKTAEACCQQLDQHSNSARGILPWRAEDKDTEHGRRKMWHYGYKCSRFQMLSDQTIRNHGNTKAGEHRRSDCYGVVGFESTTRTEPESRISACEGPRLGALQNGFVLHQLVGRLRSAVRRKVCRTSDKCRVERAYAVRKERRGRLVSKPDCTVKTFLDQIDEAVAINGMDVQRWMIFRKFGKDWR